MDFIPRGLEPKKTIIRTLNLVFGRILVSKSLRNRYGRTSVARNDVKKANKRKTKSYTVSLIPALERVSS